MHQMQMLVRPCDVTHTHTHGRASVILYFRDKWPLIYPRASIALICARFYSLFSLPIFAIYVPNKFTRGPNNGQRASVNTYMQLNVGAVSEIFG